jgi:hypothetical protein
MNTMHRLGLGVTIALLLAVGGCGNGVSAQSTAEVRKGAAEGAKRDAEALMDATYAREQARKHALNGEGAAAPGDAASTRVAALASADAVHAAAISRCDAQPAEPSGPCKERADSELATARARAEAAGLSGSQ